MFKKNLLKLLVLFGILGLFFSSWLLWMNDSLIAQNSSISSSELSDEFDNAHYPVLLSEPIKQLLNQGVVNPNINTDSALKLLELYLQRNPLDAKVWLMGSQLYQRNGDINQASLYLAVAHRLSETNTTVLMKVFNRYLELNLIDEAMSVAHDISIAKPSEFRRLFFLMGRLSNDYVRVANEVIPKVGLWAERGNVNSLEDDAYYNWALSDAIKAKNKGLASAVWKVIPVEYKYNSGLGIRYLDFLVELQDFKSVNDIWDDVVGSPMVVGQITPQGGDKVSPCWNFDKNKGFDLNITLDERSSALLELAFLGDSNINFNHISCLIPVQPGVRYQLSGRFKGDKISTLSGPYLDVYFPGMKKGRRRTDSAIGSWPWTEFELLFDVPESAYFAKVRIRRNKTKLLDSKISGSVWFDSMKLSQLSQSTPLLQ